MSIHLNKVIMERLVKYLSKIVGNNADVAVEENYDEIIEQIHKEFNTAGDELLAQANAILDKAEGEDFSKAEKLAKFGFKSVPELKEKEALKEKIKMSKEQAELIKQYKRKYPLNNFITEEQVKQICDKYNLVHGEVSKFKGFVPKKNLDEIERFKVRDEDVIFLRADECDYKGRPTGRVFQLKDAYISNYCKTKQSRLNKYREDNPMNYYALSSVEFTSRYEHIYRHGVEGKYAFQRGGVFGNTFYADDSDNIFGLKNENIDRLLITDPRDSLTICAPVKDMDMTGMEITQGYKMTKKVEIPDPVVLQEVYGGYLIVTAWGDEASDPIVVNPINN